MRRVLPALGLALLFGVLVALPLRAFVLIGPGSAPPAATAGSFVYLAPATFVYLPNGSFVRIP
jgi:hypothetical protein